MRVIIVGAGLAGLSAAVGLQHAGVDDVAVVEQAEELHEIGAGIQMPNNGARILEAWGLAEGLRSRGVVSPGSYSYDLKSDSDLLFTEAGEWGSQIYGAHFYQIRRTALLDLLRGSLGRTRLELGSRCESVEQTPGGVTCKLENGRVLSGDILIAADGIHSAVRERLFDQSREEYAGYAAWRSLLSGEGLERLDLPFGTHTWFGADRSVIAYWTDAHRTFNFIGMVPDAEVHRESWSARGAREELQASFVMACPRVKEIVAKIRDPFVTGLYRRETLERWVDGRIALIGDAAHPMVPFLANGANQSIEDAYVLSQCLARCAATGGHAPDALKEFEQRRTARANTIVKFSEIMMQIYHAKDPDVVARRDGLFSRKAQADPHGEWVRSWVWGYDAIEAMNTPVNGSGFTEPEVLIELESVIHG